MIIYTRGNLLLAKQTYLCHQTNCVTNRSAHLAADVFKMFPYANIYEGRTKPDRPGSIVLSGNGKDQRYIVNMLAQYYPGKPRSPHSKLDGYAARLGFFTKCLTIMQDWNGDFAFPYGIGCGAAGGSWEVYIGLIQEFSWNISGNVVIYRL